MSGIFSKEVSLSLLTRENIALRWALPGGAGSRRAFFQIPPNQWGITCVDNKGCGGPQMSRPGFYLFVTFGVKKLGEII